MVWEVCMGGVVWEMCMCDVVWDVCMGGVVCCIHGWCGVVLFDLKSTRRRRVGVLWCVVTVV